MKVTISDAFILLDLFSLKIIEQFFNLDIEVHAPNEILDELSTHQKEVMIQHVTLNRLIVHICVEQDWIEIYQKKYPNTIAHNDKVALYLSEKLNTILLSTDQVVRQIAKNNSIKYHGILWIIDRLVESGTIARHEGVQLLKHLSDSNKFYRQNAEFSSQIEKRVQNWKTSENIIQID